MTTWNAGPVVEWLLREGRLEADPLKLIDALATRLLAAGTPLWRLRLAFFTLHPQLVVWAYVWRRGRETRVEPIPHGIMQTEAFIGSPAERMLAADASVRYRLDRLAPGAHRLLHELAAEGGTDYLMLPLRFSDRSRNVLAVATDRPGGFGTGDLAEFERLSHAAAAVLEIAATRRLAYTLLDTYVGRRAGRRILEGQIRRGGADVIHAALWYADLRDFTPLTESLPAPELIETLNSYFETIAAAVAAHDGEILRFIGDAMLIVFPAGAGRSLAQACRAALDASLAAAAGMTRLNAERRRAGKSEVRFGTGLSAGEVIYGNVGAPERLDFTVMGVAVNRAARMEALTKELGVALLMSAEVAAHVERPVRSLGPQRLRGLHDKVEVYALAEQPMEPRSQTAPRGRGQNGRDSFPPMENRMSIEKVVRIFAGAVVLVSLALAVMVNLNWLWLTAFVGANLFQSGFTGICPLESILKRTPWFRSSVHPA